MRLHVIVLALQIFTFVNAFQLFKPQITTKTLILKDALTQYSSQFKSSMNQGVEDPILNSAKLTSHIASINRAIEYENEATLDSLLATENLPNTFNPDDIRMYWKSHGFHTLTRRWTEFLAHAVPFLTKIMTISTISGSIGLNSSYTSLARDLCRMFENLGPTYIRLGKMLSNRHDLLPSAVLEELKNIRDPVKPMDVSTVMALLEEELPGPLRSYFKEISETPSSYSSFHQIHRARLASTGEYVSIKIQRPDALESVSKDLYVLQKAVNILRSFTSTLFPNQHIDIEAFYQDWAEGLYKELDYVNEAANQVLVRDLLVKEGIDIVHIPKVYNDICTSKVLVTEWISGIPLSKAPNNVIKSLIPGAQEAFLTQLLQIGFIQGDPRPDTMIYMSQQKGNAKLALIDFGQVTAVKQSDMDALISGLVHLVNRDYVSLMTDFTQLGILPHDYDAETVIPLFENALNAPKTDCKGISKIEAITSALKNIPYSIPPNVARIGHAIITLENIAKASDPSYEVLSDAYPFVARKLLSEERPDIQRTLKNLLTSSNRPNSNGFVYRPMSQSSGKKSSYDNQRGSIIQPNKLETLLSSALSNANSSQPSQILASLKLFLSPQAKSLRNVVAAEIINSIDILGRQAVRKMFSPFIGSSSNKAWRIPMIGSIIGIMSSFPKLPASLPIPLFLPSKAAFDSTARTIAQFLFKSANVKFIQSTPRPMSSLHPSNSNKHNNRLFPVIASPSDVIDSIAPALSPDEEAYGQTLLDAIKQSLGSDIATIIGGEGLYQPLSMIRAMSTFVLAPISYQMDKLGRYLLNIRSAKKRGSVEELIHALRGLNVKEASVLFGTLEDVFKGVGGKIFDRLQKRFLNIK